MLLWELRRVFCVRLVLSLLNYGRSNSPENKRSVGGLLSTPKVDSSRPPTRKCLWGSPPDPH